MYYCYVMYYYHIIFQNTIFLNNLHTRHQNAENHETKTTIFFNKFCKFLCEKLEICEYLEYVWPVQKFDCANICCEYLYKSILLHFCILHADNLPLTSRNIWLLYLLLLDLLIGIITVHVYRPLSVSRAWLISRDVSPKILTRPLKLGFISGAEVLYDSHLHLNKSQNNSKTLQ